MKILIVESKAKIRKQLKSFLVLEGYDVLTAENGNEALQKTLLNKPDIIISDIIISQLNGYDLLKTLKQIKSTKSIPFIFLTSKNNISYIRSALLLGADDYLLKPIEINCLTNSIYVAMKKNLKKKKLIRMTTKQLILLITNYHK